MDYVLLELSSFLFILKMRVSILVLMDYVLLAYSDVDDLF